MPDVTLTYISFGSNKGHRLHALQKAIYALGTQVGDIQAVSPVYETPAQGFEGEDFLNMCVAVNTSLTPDKLMVALIKIEQNMGRVRNPGLGYQSRIIDLDILYYGDQVIQSETLSIPHPEIQNRIFVLKPLADIAPQFYHPVLGKDTRNMLQECTDRSAMAKVHPPLAANRESFFSGVNFLAIEGNIGAGKTSLAKRIAGDFNAKIVLERFADNPFLPKFYKDQNRYAFPLEMSFLADRYQQFTDDTSQLDLFKNFMVSDYDIYKSLIFAQITLQKDEFNLYRKIFNSMYTNVKKPDLYVYLYQNTERLIDNIRKRGRSYEQEIEPEYLNHINKGYLDFIKSQQEQKSAILDISELDFIDLEGDYQQILEEIEGYWLQ
ncbi:MAG: 2-amino-4-hydroxy-6-hydroxymethyldihydropteridine diphosphokinase [Eudoraea sp.]|nr:2-amino-4-hydroxy-6-hydroxymethyldihydropteridine diphosphokinase [Eudoraea sp.]